jgi:hypothetical protein
MNRSAMCLMGLILLLAVTCGGTSAPNDLPEGVKTTTTRSCTDIQLGLIALSVQFSWPAPVAVVNQKQNMIVFQWTDKSGALIQLIYSEHPRAHPGYKFLDHCDKEGELIYIYMAVVNPV